MGGAYLQLLLIFRRTKLSTVLVLLAFAAQGCAQDAEKVPAAILELGAAGDWSVKDATASFGPNVAVEVTPVKHWLETPDTEMVRLFARLGPAIRKRRVTQTIPRVLPNRRGRQFPLTGRIVQFCGC